MQCCGTRHIDARCIPVETRHLKWIICWNKCGKNEQNLESCIFYDGCQPFLNIFYSSWTNKLSGLKHSCKKCVINPFGIVVPNHPILQNSCSTISLLIQCDIIFKCTTTTTKEEANLDGGDIKFCWKLSNSTFLWIVTFSLSWNWGKR